MLQSLAGWVGLHRVVVPRGEAVSTARGLVPTRSGKALGSLLASRQNLELGLGVLVAVALWAAFTRGESVPSYAWAGAGLAGIALGLVCSWHRQRAERFGALSERRRLSRELHDGLANQLAALTWRLSSAGKSTQDPRLADLERASRELQGELRQVVLALSEPQLALSCWTSGLRSKVEALAKAHAQASGLPSQPCVINLTLTGDPERQISGGLCREFELMVLESTYNALRHSGCTKILVDIKLGRALEVEVADDGAGMLGTGRRVEPGEAPNWAPSVPLPAGGLANLRVRAERLQGRFSMTSGSSGTRLRLEVPVRQAH